MVKEPHLSRAPAISTPFRPWISCLSAVAALGITIGGLLLVTEKYPVMLVTVWSLVVLLLLVIIVLCFFDIFYVRWKIASLEKISLDEKKQLEKIIREAKQKPNDVNKGS